MAESILFTVVAEIITKLGSRQFQELTSWGGVKDELEKFKTTVSTIQAVLLDAEEKYSKSNQVRVWVDSLKEVFYDAEDLLDEFSTEVLQQQMMAGNKMAKEVRRFFSSSNQFTFGLKMAHKIKAVRDRLDVIVANRRFHLEEHGVETNVLSREREQTHSSPPEIIVGREDDKQAIIELLMASNYEENVVVIPIVGIGGLGKTTLTQLVYNDERVKTHFEPRNWVCVSDEFDVKLIVQKILESITGERCFSFEMETLKNRLHEKINGKRYLLVLDDNWCDNFERWSRLRDLLVGGARGSRIIITTRNKKVAEIVSTCQPYELDGLSEIDSWCLFKLMAFKHGKVPSPSFEAIGKEIVGKYVGVPLAIRTIGRLLYFKNAAGWLSFKNKELTNVDQNENDILSTLKLSYDHLPPCLKHCFAYCRIFPKGSKINVKTLIHLWMAQGYVKSSDPSQCLEDVGFEYFNDLLWRSFFQEVEKDHFGNLRTCRIHDLMHDLCVSVVGSGSNLPSSNVNYVSKGTQHVSVDYYRDVALTSLDVRKIRTFFLSRDPRHGRNKNQCYEIFSNLRSVRALDAHNSGIMMVPRSIEKLKHIRFLDLSYNTRIEMLPDSITKLQNLQVFKLAGLRRLKQLPNDIRKLVYLMHLDLWKCDGLTHMPPRLGQLTSLRYMSRFLVAKNDGVSKHVSRLGELRDLNNLRGLLEIMNLQNVKHPASEFGTANLKEKQHLQTLRLAWKSGDDDDNTESGSNDAVSLEKLQPHKNLQWLDVRGWGRLKFPSWVASLTSLVELRIDNCVECQYLPPLDQFPSLKHLTLDELSDLKYIESGITSDNAESGSALFFPSLEKLWLRNCPNLKGWCRKDTSTLEIFQFHCLAYLEIKSCTNLTSMPLIPTVERLVLKKASVKVVEDILKLKILLPQYASSSSSSSSSVSPSLIQLKELSIQKIEDLDFLPEELLQKLTSLQQLDIIDCPRITTLCHDMQSLASLEVLIIRDCDELDLSSGQWQCLRSLRKLRIVNLAQLVYLPQDLQHLTTLQQLTISSCPILESLPEWIIDLTALRHLEISECPRLSNKCSNNKGEDWSKIAHIPNIKIDARWIQLKGYYEL